MSIVTILHQKLDLTDVRDITVSDIVDDNGQKLRTIRIFGDPIVNNSPTAILEGTADRQTRTI